MSFNIEVRKKQLLSLEQYINASKNRVIFILHQLGWNAKQVLEVIRKVFAMFLIILIFFLENRTLSMPY